MLDRPYEIYLIASDDYWYVGSASGNQTAKNRWRAHVTGTNSGTSLLHPMIKKIGANKFCQTILETGTGNPIVLEQKWYDWYLANDPRETLNGARPGLWNRHEVWTEEARQKARERMLGNTHTLGYKASSETKALMSLQRVGRELSEYHRKRISEGLLGHIVTDETKENISRAKKGKRLNIVLKEECTDCGLISRPCSMAMHIKGSGHKKRVIENA